MKGYNLHENKVTNMKVTQIKKEGHRYRAVGHDSKKQKMSKYVTKKDYDKFKKQKQKQKQDECEDLCTIL